MKKNKGKKKVSLDLEILELEAKVAPSRQATICQYPAITGAEC